uniref:Ovule protein n=1 Tax=Heterorhabditis bacteriophora TaxID=37862 RepID=A0A1I7XNL1_HETBA
MPTFCILQFLNIRRIYGYSLTSLKSLPRIFKKETSPFSCLLCYSQFMNNGQCHKRANEKEMNLVSVYD